MRKELPFDDPESDTPKSYADAMDELQRIVEAVQNEQVGIDELSGLIQRANELIAWCRTRLRQVEEDIEKNNF